LKIPKPLSTATLPQYLYSPSFMERFLDAIHEDGKEIERSKNEPGTIKLVDEKEMSADFFDYFNISKPHLEVEFYEDLSNEIGEENVILFCDVIAKDWYDGKKLRQGERVHQLLVSIRNYLEYLNPNIEISNFVERWQVGDLEPLFDVHEVKGILDVNYQIMYRCLEDWKSKHPLMDEITNSEIFLRRGLSLDKEFNTDLPYKEWSYINSYSIATSVSEKFAQMQHSSLPALVNGDINLFDNRILFFSPFVRGLPVGQLEAGVIPSSNQVLLKSQGIHSGIHEYIMGTSKYDLNFHAL